MELREYREASVRIAPFMVHTPLLHSEVLDECIGFSRVWLKCENFQTTGSFKVRGAVNAVIQKGAHGQSFVCRSSGNFAQALAYAGRRLHCPVTVVMPETAPNRKVELTKKQGAEVILHGTTYHEGYSKAKELTARAGGMFVSCYDDLDVIAGQGTSALEIFEELPSLNYFFCPIGGGGLLAGCGDVLKQLNADIQVVAVEPEGARDFYLSMEKGSPVERKDNATIADGLRAPRVGEHNWPMLKKCVDQVQLVSDEDIVKAMQLLFEIFGIVAEPSGAVSLAGLLKADQEPMKGDIVCVISGGNVDRDQFIRWMQGE